VILNAAFEFLRGRKRAYQSVFNKSAAANLVLADLANFCRATTTCYDPDTRRTDILIGRNEVWKRIEHHLQLTPEQLYAIFGGTPTRPQQSETDE
jgi:hypothetical protein